MQQRQDGDLTRRPGLACRSIFQGVAVIRTTSSPGLNLVEKKVSSKTLYRAECQGMCPNAFPPELDIIHKILNIEEGSEAMLRINASGNPFPDISWQFEGADVVLDDRIQLDQDKSLKIVRVESSDSGIWTVMANNGLGQVVRRQLSLTVYPSSIPITIALTEAPTTYESGEEIRIGCQVCKAILGAVIKWYTG